MINHERISDEFSQFNSAVGTMCPRFRLRGLHRWGKTVFVDDGGGIQAGIADDTRTLEYLWGSYLADESGPSESGVNIVEDIVYPTDTKYSSWPQATLSAVSVRGNLSPVKYIVALRGKAFAGKSYIGECIAKSKEAEFDKIPFAEQLKRVARSTGWDGKKDALGRKLLQDIGDAGRAYNPFQWANSVAREILLYAPNQLLIVDDLRFPEALLVLRGVAGVLRAKLAVIEVKADAKSLKKRRGENADPGKHESETRGAELTRMLRTAYFKKVLRKSVDNSEGKKRSVVADVSEVWDWLKGR